MKPARGSEFSKSDPARRKAWLLDELTCRMHTAILYHVGQPAWTWQLSLPSEQIVHGQHHETLQQVCVPVVAVGAAYPRLLAGVEAR